MKIIVFNFITIYLVSKIKAKVNKKEICHLLSVSNFGLS